MALKSALAAAVARKNRSRGKFIQALNQRGSYVQGESGGNKQAIISSALGVQRQPKPVGILSPPRGLTVEVGTARGEMIITWDKVKHALMYFLEYGVEGANPEILGLTGLRKKTLLLPHLGATYHFLLCASGTSGNSPWSPTVRRIAS
jgi:hypothetical protein